MYTCLSSHSNIWEDKREESKKHSLFVNFHKFDVVSHSPADSVPVHSNHLLWVEWYFSTQKYCLMVLLLCRNCFFSTSKNAALIESTQNCSTQLYPRISITVHFANQKPCCYIIKRRCLSVYTLRGATTPLEWDLIRNWIVIRCKYLIA